MRRVVGVAGVLMAVLAVVGLVRFVVPAPGVDDIPGSAVKQLRFLRQAIDGGADHDAQRLFPEGYFFVNALYGLAWVQVGQTEPEHAGKALAEARWALARLESSDGTAPFDRALRPAYGIFHAGWTNQLRGGVLSLQRDRDPAEVRRYEQATAEIASAFQASGTPFLQAYPGQAWPVDSVVAVATLRQHDRLLVPRYAGTLDEWLQKARTRLDGRTGLLPHQVDAEGNGIGGARATSQSVIHHFLTDVDAGFGREQYQRFREQFVAHPLGFGPAVREYPRGTDGTGDVDSGPLVLWVSLSATVVTLGAARVQHDHDLAAALHHQGELAGVPLTGLRTKRYAFGVLPVADAFLVWSQTARPSTDQPLEQGVAWWWRLPWLLPLILLIAAGLWLARTGLRHGSRPRLDR